jgi:hypothetical protein
MILGHHPHLLKAIELNRRKPIFYSLGNFAIEQPSAFKADVHLDRAFAQINALSSSAWAPESRYMTPPETRHTLIARCAIAADGTIAVSCLPCRIDDDSVPRRLRQGEPHFAEMIDYLVAVTAEAGIDTRFTVAGDAIILS